MPIYFENPSIHVFKVCIKLWEKNETNYKRTDHVKNTCIIHYTNRK